MTFDFSPEELELLGAAIARHLSAPADLEMLSLKRLAAETGMSYDVLAAACRSYEAGSKDGLRCARASEVGSKSGPILVTREWFAAWRERRADLNTKTAAVT